MVDLVALVVVVVKQIHLVVQEHLDKEMQVQIRAVSVLLVEVVLVLLVARQANQVIEQVVLVVLV
jgi:hypothetical protein